MTSKLRVSTAQYSNKGRKPNNQDCCGLKVPHGPQLLHKGVAIAVADGISSSDVSHIASEVAVKNFLEDYYCTSETWTVKRSVECVLNAANSWLHSQTVRGAGRYDKDKGYVCTFSAVVIKNRTAHIFHVGDTRVYRLNAEGLEQLTHDHRLWASEADSYLSRAMGIEAQCSFDQTSVDIKEGDVFITATDGVYEHLTAKEIIEAVSLSSDLKLQEVADNLGARAFAKGSEDNLSVQLLRIDSLQDAVTAAKAKVELLPFPPALTARMAFDGYAILRTIYSTSRSHVYLAQDIKTQKKVVLKALATELAADEDALERFLMEQWIAQRINSSHVLKAFLPEQERNYIYTVFEYIEGQTLAQWALDNPKPSLETVRGLVEQVAKGLQAFHRLEMLHQDIRPENVMIDTEGTVKIIDFGAVSIAGLAEASSNNSHTFVLGTALYSAPEYFLGEAGTVRSEQFSLGVITYFLLSGRYPYGTRVARAKTLAAQRKLSYQSVLTEGCEIPAWVDFAIEKSVQVLPDKRYEDIFEFIHDLRQPNKSFLNKARPPLLERNPVAVWQGISLFLLVVIVYLLNA